MFPNLQSLGWTNIFQVKTIFIVESAVILVAVESSNINLLLRAIFKITHLNVLQSHPAHILALTARQTQHLRSAGNSQPRAEKAWLVSVRPQSIQGLVEEDALGGSRISSGRSGWRTCFSDEAGWCAFHKLT